MQPRVLRRTIFAITGALLLFGSTYGTLALVDSPGTVVHQIIVPPPTPAPTLPPFINPITPAPVATPTPIATPTPAPVPPAGTSAKPRPSLRSAPKSTPTPPYHPRNRLVGPGLNVGVSIYSDCSGRTELTRRTAALDTCISRYNGDNYFIGHSYGGVFTPLSRGHVIGEIITWYNNAGVAHRYKIEGEQYTHALGAPDVPPPGTAAQFQTCLTPNGSSTATFYAILV